MSNFNREEFGRALSFMYRNMGDEFLRQVRPGIEYFMSLEGELEKTRKLLEEAKSELVHVSGELARYKAGSETTTEMRSICKNTKSCPNWEPCPDTPGEGSGVNGAALVPDWDRAKTEKLPTVGHRVVVVKPTIWGRILGKILRK